MHATIAYLTLSLIFLQTAFASPLSPSPPNPLTLADTVQFISKTIGPNPNPDTLPDVNNWQFIPLHTGDGSSLGTLESPSNYPFNLTYPGFFRNGTNRPHSTGGYMTAGLHAQLPWSLVLAVSHNPADTNPGAVSGVLEFNVGVGTDGLDVPSGQLITSNYVSDSFWACPAVKWGANVVAVGVSNRYVETMEGCWGIELYAQCAGVISERNKAAFPAFAQSVCYVNASLAVVGEN